MLISGMGEGRILKGF